jgi:gas vesicle protein
LEEITEKFMENIQDMVNQNVQGALEKFQDTKDEQHRKTKKQINELTEDFKKYQSEIKDTIERLMS